MITPTYPGVYVLEQASGARAISGVATSITAFVGMTQRGPLLSPRRILSPRDYDRIFGPGGNSGAMAAQLRLFFDNGGGEAWVTRIAQDSAPADITLFNEDGGDAIQLTALEDGVLGNNLRAEVDYDTPNPESTFNLRLYRRVALPDGTATEADAESFANLSMNPAETNYAGTALANVSALARVDVTNAPQAAAQAESRLYSGLILPSAAGAATTSVFARLGGGAGTYTLRLRYNQEPPTTVNVVLDGTENALQVIQAIGTAMSNRLSDIGFVQIVAGNQINAGSLRQYTIEMPGASFEISAGPVNDLAVPLMLTVSSGAVYVDQFALNRPAPSGYVSRLHGTPAVNDLAALVAFAGHAKSDVAEWQITDASPAGAQPAAAIVYPAAAGPMIEGTRFSPTAVGDTSQGALTNVQENLQAIADAVTADTADRWTAEVHGHRLVMRPNFGTSDADTTAVFLTQQLGGGGGVDIGGAGQILDTGVDVNVAAYTLGRAGTGLGGGSYQNRAGATDGDDGFVPTVPEYEAAYFEMDRLVPLFNILVQPRARDINGPQSDTARKDAFNAASAYVERRRAILLADPPSTDPAISWDDAGEASAGANAFRIGIETRNTAVYWPPLRVAGGDIQDPAGPMAGLLARTDATRGVWKAAAGVEATLRAVTGVQHPMSDAENGLINPRAINAIRVFPSGIVSWGARMLVGFDGSGNVDDKYMPVRRTMLFIEESLYRGLRFAVFEPNDEPLWAQIRLAAGSFMNTLFRQGAFAGAKSSDAYFVNCDASTTTPTDINLGIVNVVVGFAPLKPAEFVVLTVTQIAGQDAV